MSVDAVPDHVLDYVRAASLMLDLTLDAAQMQRVAVHLERTQAMAQALAAAELAAHDEPAEIFCPAPFPSEENVP
ncbi:AtzG-like protein [Piscinibacter terrae]|uniref:DUF4089 domain-containing protein n=1 Tax=Piscinibacter terrae TaxID=2496871 RepID=A0A3N7HGT8_9BURK|nr:AtzG-like protein [Albitalea terrae]RQP21224.1 DUF4089 domain-containing protein [Albitalea terrae]